MCASKSFMEEWIFYNFLKKSLLELGLALQNSSAQKVESNFQIWWMG